MDTQMPRFVGLWAAWAHLNDQVVAAFVHFSLSPLGISKEALVTCLLKVMGGQEAEGSTQR